MAEIQPTVRLTEEQVEFFHREGYLAIDAITTPEEVDRLRLIYDHLFEVRAGREVGDQFDLAGTDEEGKEALLPQILTPARYAPQLNSSLYHVNARSIAQQLLGPDAVYLEDHAIFKPAKIGAQTPWHQDEAYWQEELQHHALSIWMPLQEATRENGCMAFIPRSHLLEVLPHHTINNDPRIHGLEVDNFDTSNAVLCPLPAGGATIHHCRTLHHTGPNVSDLPRRAYILTFGLPPKPLSVPRDFYWNKQKRTPREERKGAAERKAEPGAA